MLKSMFFDSVSGDRRYTSGDMATVLARLAGSDGVVFGYGDQLAVSPGTGLTVQVATGAAFVQGRYVEVLSTETLAIASADPTNPRIDRVVVRLDTSQDVRAISLAVKTGTPAASPTPPTLQRDGTVWELSLAQVYVAAGATSISSENITDERSNETVCGYTPRTPDIVHRGAQEDAIGLSNIIDSLSGKFDSTTGHKHTGAVGDGPRLTHDAIDTAKVSAFRAHQSTAQSIPASTWTTVAFQAEEYDQLGEYNPATYTFTPSKGGLYLISAGIQTVDGTPDGTRGLLGLSVGQELKANLAAATTGGATRVELYGSTLWKLAEGDAVTIWVYLTSALNLASGVYFTAMRVA